MKERLGNCTGIPGKQWFLQDTPSVAGIVGRYVCEVANLVLKHPKWIKVCIHRVLVSCLCSTPENATLQHNEITFKYIIIVLRTPKSTKPIISFEIFSLSNTRKVVLLEA